MIIIILVILNTTTNVVYRRSGNEVMALCLETAWKSWYNCNYMKSGPTVSGQRPIANNKYANSGNPYTVNIKRNIQMLRQTSITQYTSLFKNLELIWTADGSVYTTTEICVHVSSVNLCIIKREGMAPKSNVYVILHCSGGKLIQFLA
jgi:hypothetical protein